MYAAVGTCNGWARGSRTIAVLRGRLRVVDAETPSATATATLDVDRVEALLTPDAWTSSLYPRYAKALREVTAAVASGRAFDRATFAPVARAHDRMTATYGEANLSLFEVDAMLRRLRRDAERGDVEGAVHTLARTRCLPLHAESDLQAALEARRP